MPNRYALLRPESTVGLPNWSCRWDPLLPYNNLPPIPGEQLTTRAVERRCKLAVAALETLRDATSELTDPYALFQWLVRLRAGARRCRVWC